MCEYRLFMTVLTFGPVLKLIINDLWPSMVCLFVVAYCDRQSRTNIKYFIKLPCNAGGHNNSSIRWIHKGDKVYMSGPSFVTM